MSHQSPEAFECVCLKPLSHWSPEAFELKPLCHQLSVHFDQRAGASAEPTSLTLFFPPARFLCILHLREFLGPPMSVFANSKCVGPRRMSFNCIRQFLIHHVSIQCQCDIHRHTPWRPETLNFGHFFPRKPARRPPDLRFDRFQVCVTLGCPLRTRVASFIT